MFFTLAWVLQLSNCLPHIHAPALMLCSPSNLLVRHLVSQVLSQDISLDNEDSSTLKVATHIVPKWIGLVSLLTTQDKFNYFDSYFPLSLPTLGANEKNQVSVTEKFRTRKTALLWTPTAQVVSFCNSESFINSGFLTVCRHKRKASNEVPYTPAKFIHRNFLRGDAAIRSKISEVPMKSLE